jgi:hypothetical protein
MAENQAPSQKPIIIARAVSIEEMLNLINDKIDYLISKQQEKK